MASPPTLLAAWHHLRRSLLAAWRRLRCHLQRSDRHSVAVGSRQHLCFAFARHESCVALFA
eukprot:2655722-Pleurochrysis_carterae.AAC.1